MNKSAKLECKKWYQRFHRFLRVDPLSEFGDYKYKNMKKLVRNRKNLFHHSAEWVMATPGSSPGNANYVTFNSSRYEKFPPLGDFDFFRTYVKFAKEEGLRIVAYINGHWYSYKFAKQHSDWQQFLADGTPYGKKFPLYGNGTTFCVNSPWRNWFLGLIDETIRIGIDGVFLDGPVVFPSACYCKYCKNKFMNLTGNDIPEEDWSSLLWRRFVAFREDSIAEIISDARKVVHSVNPEACLYCNAGSIFSDWSVTRNIEKLASSQDISGSESFYYFPESPWFGPYLNAKYQSSTGLPAQVFIHHALGSYHYIPLDSLELGLSVAQVCSTCASPWYAVFEEGVNRMKDKYSSAGDIYEFYGKQSELRSGLRRAGDIAVILSSLTNRFYISSQESIYIEVGSGEEKDLVADVSSNKIGSENKRKKICSELFINNLIGYSLVFVRSHIQFDYILEGSVKFDTLRGYKVLLLPNTACMNRELTNIVLNYIKSGGKVLLDLETGEYDEWGIKKQSSTILEALGIKIEEAFVPSIAEDYVEVTCEDKLTYGFKKFEIIPRPKYAFKIRIKDKSSIYYHKPQGAKYGKLETISEYPFCCQVRYGKGSVIYFSGAIGADYYNQHFDSFRKFIVNALDLLGVKPVKTSATPNVIVDIKNGIKGEKVIDLINCDYGIIRPVVNVRDEIKVSFEIQFPKKPKKVYSAKLGTLKYSFRSQKLRFILPRLKIYDTIIVV